MSGTAFRKAQISSSLVETRSAIATEQTVSVYPNPATSILNVVLSTEMPATISLIDISGKIVDTIDTDSKRIRIDVSDLSSGLYVISVNQNGKHFSKRVLIKK